MVLMAALAVCGMAWAGGSTRLSGSWAGEMRQIEVNAEDKYPMTLTLSAAGGMSNYPTLNCSGTWTKIGARSGYTIYEEKITNTKGATCIDGMVMVKLDGGKLILGWFAAYAGAPSLAAATLERSAAK
jgi:hypothetical protein